MLGHRDLLAIDGESRAAQRPEKEPMFSLAQLDDRGRPDQKWMRAIDLYSARIVFLRDRAECENAGRVLFRENGR
jgi:hypothetical protein